MPLPSVTVAGHLCVDLTPTLDEPRVEPGRLVDVGPLAIGLGGCVGNTATALADLGVPVRIAATVGDDELGVTARHAVAARFAEAEGVAVLAGESTSYSVVLQAPGRDRTFWHHTGANARFTGERVEPGGSAVLHVGYPSLLPALVADGAARLVALLAWAREAGVTTSLDLAVIDPASPMARTDWSAVLDVVLPLVDVCSPSWDDLASALGIEGGPTPERMHALADDLIARGAAVVAVSAGAHGMVLHGATTERLAEAGAGLAGQAGIWAGARLLRPPVPPERVVTTNGAGDTATAGLLAAILAGRGPADAALVAATAAAAVIAGGRPLPLVTAAPATPIVLPANQPAARFYAGGAAIAAFRGTGPAAPNTPEDWVGSVTCVRGVPEVGTTTLPDGTRLAAAIAADPAGWLGAAHVARFGADPKVLVKLLDAGQRLPVHAHPHRDFAGTHLGAAHGKAEAWHILTPGVVHLGLVRDVAPEALAALVAAQDTAALLALLHEIPVAAGDAVYMPPGVLHAIGAGVLLAEVQEPEDLSILLEWRGFGLDGTRDGHLGLGFPAALGAVEHTARDVTGLVVRAGAAAGLPPLADEYFRMTAVAVDGEAALDAGFRVLVGTDGETIVHGAGEPVALTRGATVLVPAAAGPLRLAGRGALIDIRPPAA